MNKDTPYNVILHHAYGLKLSCFDLGGCQDYWNLLRRPEDGICACGYAKPSTARLFSVALFIRQMLLCDMAYIVSVTVMDVASPCPSIVQALQTAIDAAHVRSSEEGGR